MGTAGGYIGLIGGLALAVMAFIRIFLMRQITDLREDVDRLNREMHDMKQENDRERGEKHKAKNDIAKAVMALELVNRLAKECSCGVLAPLGEIIDRLFEELETVAMNHRRFDDPA